MLTALGVTLGAADMAPGAICTTNATWSESIGVGDTVGAALGLALDPGWADELDAGLGLALDPGLALDRGLALDPGLALAPGLGEELEAGVGRPAGLTCIPPLQAAVSVLPAARIVRRALRIVRASRSNTKIIRQRPLAVQGQRGPTTSFRRIVS